MLSAPNASLNVNSLRLQTAIATVDAHLVERDKDGLPNQLLPMLALPLKTLMQGEITVLYMIH